MHNTHPKLIVGNWKMNPSSTKEATSLIKNIHKGLKKIKQKVVICPPSIFLPVLYKEKSTYTSFGLQNTSFEDVGAHTGEVSLELSKSFKPSFVILGHSEVRAQGESSSLVNQKVKYCLKKGVTPIVCVGEKDRNDSHGYFSFIENQIQESLGGLTKKDVSKLVIAYEPIWAIGKNALRDATPEEFNEVKIFIKKVLQDMYSISGTEVPSILYGGSVNEKNASLFIHKGHADGLLIGRTSLDAKKFIELVKNI